MRFAHSTVVNGPAFHSDIGCSTARHPGGLLGLGILMLVPPAAVAAH
ncbi:hypothetical protein AB0I51_43005 [Streptomyces sp. NPDC050549]